MAKIGRQKVRREKKQDDITKGGKCLKKQQQKNEGKNERKKMRKNKSCKKQGKKHLKQKKQDTVKKSK